MPLQDELKACDSISPSEGTREGRYLFSVLVYLRLVFQMFGAYGISVRSFEGHLGSNPRRYI